MSNNSKPMKQGIFSNPCLGYASDYHGRHLVDLIMDSDRDNPLFRSPVGINQERPLEVLDIGTGKGTWAMYVDCSYAIEKAKC